MTFEEILKSEESFRYQMLDRMKSDCIYYLDGGNRKAKYLWSGDETEQIKNMLSLWDSFPKEKKPEWLSKMDIYMLGYRLKAKITCRRNEMHEICSECVSRWYKDDIASAFKPTSEEYFDMVFDILPMDLSEYTYISEETKEKINKYFDEEDVNRYGHKLLRTHILSGGWYRYANELNMNDYRDSSYNAIAWNDEEKLVFEYCEGDMCLTVCKTEEEYKFEKERTIKWWEEER